MKLLPLLSLCLLTWSAATFGDQHGSKVITVEEGNDVILNYSLSTNIELSLFEWKKDGQTDVFFFNGGVFKSFNGRVSYFPDKLRNGDASIMIRQTVMDDSGNYICSFPNLQPSQIFHIQLVVEPVKVIVMQDSDAILPCSLGSGENIESTTFDWMKDYQKDDSKNVFMYDGRKPDLSGKSEQFRGRVSHFPEELKNGNASIKITETKLADGGVYTCIFPYLQPQRKFNIELVVDAILKDRSRDVKGAASKPSVGTVDQTKDWALLQCEVLGASPKPQLQWQDSDGNLVPAKDPQEEKRGGSYDIILQATVTKTDTYRCVVTQKEINHHTQAETFVYISESSQSSTERIVAGVVVVLGGILLVVLVVL